MLPRIEQVEHLQRHAITPVAHAAGARATKRTARQWQPPRCSTDMRDYRESTSDQANRKFLELFLRLIQLPLAECHWHCQWRPLVVTKLLKSSVHFYCYLITRGVPHHNNVLYHFNNMFLLLNIITFFLCLFTYTSSFQFIPCPLSPTSSPSELLAGSASLLASGDAASARTCLLIGKAPLADIAIAQLAALTREISLSPQRDLPSHSTFTNTWNELMELMEKLKIFTLSELNELNTPLNVFVLHGQLSCLQDRASALDSLMTALHERENPFIRELVARIALGRGDAVAALSHSTLAVSKLQPGVASHTCGPLLILQLQAAAMLEGSVGFTNTTATTSSTTTTSISSSSRSSSKTLPESYAAFLAVRKLIRLSFKEAHEKFTHDDPMGKRSVDNDDDDDEEEEELEGKGLINIRENGITSTTSNVIAQALARTDAAWLRAAQSPHIAASFRADGYVVLRRLLPPEYFRALTVRVKSLFIVGGRGEGRIADDLPQHRQTLWNDELSLYVGLRLVPIMSALVGRPVVSVYTFAIRYEEGGVLHPHKDRQQNSISVSLNIGLEPEDAEPWPLWVSPVNETEAGGIPIALRSNDALLYGGVEHTHFRHTLRAPNGSVAPSSSLQVIFGFREINQAHCNSQ